jgi:hypothetical protein
MTKKKNNTSKNNATKATPQKDTSRNKDVVASNDTKATTHDQAPEKKDPLVIRTKGPKTKHQTITENEQEPVLEPIFITSK